VKLSSEFFDEVSEAEVSGIISCIPGNHKISKKSCIILKVIFYPVRLPLCAASSKNKKRAAGFHPIFSF
jgi:hypothetical protein